MLSLARHRPPTHPAALPSSAGLCTPASSAASHCAKYAVGLSDLPLGLHGYSLNFDILGDYIYLNFLWTFQLVAEIFQTFSGAVVMLLGWRHAEAGLQQDESFRVTHIPSLA